MNAPQHSATLPQPIAWPRLDTTPDGEDRPAVTRFDAMDIAEFAASIRQGLSRAIGKRVSIQPQHSTQKVEHGTTSWLRMARLATQNIDAAPRASATGRPDTDDEPQGMLLLSSPELIAFFAEMVFGGFRESARPTATESGMERLPPGSATWSVLAHLFGVSCARALAASGIDSRIAELPARAALSAPVDGASSLVFEVDAGGATGRLLLVDLDSVPAPPPEEISEQPDPRQWRIRARERTLAVDLPVSLQLEEMHMSLAEVTAFQPGDVVTINRPQSFSLMIGGRRIGRIPASAISGKHRMDQSERQQG